MKPIFCLIIFLTASSCEFQKRVHRKGFYSSFFGNGNAFVCIPKDNKKKVETINAKPQYIASSNFIQHPEKTVAKDETSQFPKKIKVVLHKKEKLIFEQKLKQIEPDTLKTVDYFELQKIKNLSTASLVFSIMGALSLFYIIGTFLCLLGLIFGLTAILRAKKIPYPIKRIGQAKFGVCLSIIGLLIGIGYIVLYVIAA